MTYREALAWGQEQLRMAEVPDFALDAGYLLEFTSGRKHIDLVLDGREQMTDALFEKYRDCVRRRAQRIPLQQITGSQAFMGLDFMVNEHVLCPRQDTETLVEEGLTILASLQSGSAKNGQANADREIRLLDLCTGSGCILISLLALARGQETPIHGLAADLSPEALAVARENAKRNGVSAAFVLSDLFAEIEGSFDLITANPPYIPSGQLEDLMPEVRDHEPRMALDGDEDGLAFYRRIAGQAPDYLREGGWLLMEIAFDQGQAVRQMLADGPFEEIEIIQDLSGRDRVLKGRMIHV
nr:peptide chain release factor N(5)-glutamine methyltransferase [uncultured Shuttleworthia sp.]